MSRSNSRLVFPFAALAIVFSVGCMAPETGFGLLRGTTTVRARANLTAADATSELGVDEDLETALVDLGVGRLVADGFEVGALFQYERADSTVDDGVNVVEAESDSVRAGVYTRLYLQSNDLVWPYLDLSAAVGGGDVSGTDFDEVAFAVGPGLAVPLSQSVAFDSMLQFAFLERDFEGLDVDVDAVQLVVGLFAYL